MAPPTWKLLLSFGEHSEFSSRLLKSEICPCRYCWCGKCGTKLLQESILSTFQKSTSPESSTNSQESPRWKLVLTFDDGSEFTSQPLGAQVCTCSYCWCGKCGRNRLQESDLWAFQDFLSFGAASSLRELLDGNQRTRQSGYNTVPTAEIKMDLEVKVEVDKKKHSEVIQEGDAEAPNILRLLVNDDRPCSVASTQLKSELPDVNSDQLDETDSELDQESDSKDPTWTDGESSQEVEELFNEETEDSDQDGYKSEDSDWEPDISAVASRSSKPRASNFVSNLKCSDCFQTFQTRIALDEHLKEHSPTHPFKCRYCTDRFKTRNKQHIHQRKHQDQHGRYTCSHCEYKSFKGYHLFRHIQKIHSGHKDKKSVVQATETPVEPPAADIRPFKCSQCPMSFVNKNHLAKHHQTHSGERPFQCPECPQAFFRSNNLRNHIETHNRARPHKCDQCTKAFTRSNHLRRHKHICHGSIPSYQCRWCANSFARHKDLRDHTHRHHSKRKRSRPKHRQNKVPTTALIQQPRPQASPTNGCTRVLRTNDLEEPDVILIDERINTIQTPPPKPNYCFKCSKSFYDSYNLRRHQRNVHRKLSI